MVRLVAKAGVSRRVKKLIREHGPEFTVKNQLRPRYGEEGELLVESADGWIGWLPCDQIEVNGQQTLNMEETA